MVHKRIVVLANSRKHAGRCIAGRAINPNAYGGWIRPVSNRAGEEVSEAERQYPDGSDPKVLHVIDVPLLKAHPHACQTENWLLDPTHYWLYVDSLTWEQARQLAETPPTLWVNNISTNPGLNDEIPADVAAQLPNSICMVYVNSLQIHVVNGYNKRRVQARFAHAGVSYWLWVTDPIIERRYLAMENGQYELGESLVVVSLGEPFQKGGGDWCQYKLVATILTR